MPVLGTEYLDLDQVERDFYSTSQDYVHSQQEVVSRRKKTIKIKEEINKIEI